MKNTTEQILSEIEENNTVTEKQVNLLARRLNAGEAVDTSYIWNNPPELTSEQNDKGLNFLLNLWRTPANKERKNNPFGYREENILSNFTGFELAGFYDAGIRHTYWIPLYNCIGANDSFQYYCNGGKISIVG